MKIDKNIAMLISDMEYEIGNQCYNPNSYDGYTGDQGCSFRYPVHIIDVNENSDTKGYKTRKRIENLRPEQIENIVYKFGSNYLYIGLALLKILELLENKYGLDFNELTNLDF